MLASLRGLQQSFAAARITLGRALRHKSQSPKSTGISPFAEKFVPVPRPQRFPEAVVGNSAPVKVIPAIIPVSLREKLGVPGPAARGRNVPESLKRKRREASLLRPLEELSSGPRPFRVARSRMGNFPIYTDIRNGGSKVVTILRKYTGDVPALASELEAVTGKEVTAYHGRLEVRGRHAPVIAEWLGKLGF
jgi:large subunit ribosomal protein L49